MPCRLTTQDHERIVCPKDMTAERPREVLFPNLTLQGIQPLVALLVVGLQGITLKTVLGVHKTYHACLFFNLSLALLSLKFIAYPQLASKICFNCTNSKLLPNQCTFFFINKYQIEFIESIDKTYIDIFLKHGLLNFHSTFVYLNPKAGFQESQLKSINQHSAIACTPKFSAQFELYTKL